MSPLVGSSKLLGIGTDIIYLPRMQSIIHKYQLDQSVYESRFYRIARKFMHPVELDELNLLIKHPTSCTTRKLNYIGGIWAAKEAVYKALSCFVPHQYMPPAQSLYTRYVYKTNDSNGSPILRFDYRQMENSKVNSKFYEEYIEKAKVNALISLSHDHDYLVSYVCLTSNSGVKEK